MFTKISGMLKLGKNWLVWLSQIITKIVMLWQLFGCFETTCTASLTALTVAEGSVLDNGSSRPGRLLYTSLKH